MEGQLAQHLTAEIILNQILHSAAVKNIDAEIEVNGPGSASLLSTHLQSLLSNPAVACTRITPTWFGGFGYGYACMSSIPDFPVSRAPMVHAKLAQLFNALRKPFSIWNQKTFKQESLYVVSLRCNDSTDEPLHQQFIHQYILHKQMHEDKKPTVNVAAHSNIAFIGTSEYVHPDAELQVLIKEMITGLEQLTHTMRFEIVSCVLFQCTRFPIVLIELTLEYCFCMLR